MPIPPPHSPHRHLSAALILIAGGVGGLCLPVDRSTAARPGADAAAPVEVSVVQTGSRVLFRIDTPDAPLSAAARDDRAQTRPDGSSMGWTSGYRLSSRVIVRAGDEKQVAAACAGRAVKVTPVGGGAGPLKGFYFVDAASVREAIAVADAAAGAPGVDEAYLDIDRPKTLRNNLPSDPGLSQQWHLINQAHPEADTNADVAWKAGFTGAGVTVGVLESGWDITHDDLAANYDAAGSQPAAGENVHGTATAGLVAAVANNGIGGVGVAWGSHISRLYYGAPSAIYAAFCYAPNINKVLTNSWGPPDNGVIATISSLELAGIECAATMGRGGLGDVIMWAGGNGAQFNDRVDYDPYGSNRFSIAVGAIDCMDRHAVYSEPGSSLMLVTASDYDLNNANLCGIYTTWICVGSPRDCTYTSTFGGTSAASPIAAGVAALVLQANPLLGARDVQHILIRSARRVNPGDASWGFNGAGAGSMRAWSELYGFGAIDAGLAVALAQGWVNRPAQAVQAAQVTNVNTPIPDGNTAGVSSSITIASGLIVERAEVVLNVPHAAIGQLRITLTSPSGTVATLATPRADTTPGGYSSFTFVPVRFWDERAAGTWTLRVADEVLSPAATGTFANWQLKIDGYSPACRCDWNLSGGPPTVQDIFDYLISYFNGRGDFGGDGAGTLQDLFDFLGCWFAGC